MNPGRDDPSNRVFLSLDDEDDEVEEDFSEEPLDPLIGDYGAATVHVVRFADVQAAGDAYRRCLVVDMVFEGGSEELMRRAVDFASGVAFVTGGGLDKVDGLRFRLRLPGSEPGGEAGDREPRRPAPHAGGAASSLAEPVDGSDLKLAKADRPLTSRPPRDDPLNHGWG